MSDLASLSTKANAMFDLLSDFYEEPDPSDVVPAPSRMVVRRSGSDMFERHSRFMTLDHYQPKSLTSTGGGTNIGFVDEPVAFQLAHGQNIGVFGGNPLGAAIVGPSGRYPMGSPVLSRVVADRQMLMAGPALISLYEGWSGPLGLAIHELGRLPDGWAGQGSRAPSPSILLDIQFLNAFLPQGVVTPEVEVDQDDGFVSLRWLDENAANSLTIAFFGGHRIIVTFSSLEGKDRPARELHIGEVATILGDPDFESLLTSNALP